MFNENEYLLDTTGIEEDPEYVNALTLVFYTGETSVSFLQRKLSIGYARASRFVKKMNEEGYIEKGRLDKKWRVVIDQEEGLKVLRALQKEKTPFPVFEDNESAQERLEEIFWNQDEKQLGFICSKMLKDKEMEGQYVFNGKSYDWKDLWQRLKAFFSK